MSETLLDGRVLLHCGDCRAVLATLAPDSIDAVVTDPPYHLTELKTPGQSFSSQLNGGRSPEQKRARAGFMGKSWDGGDVAFDPDTWRAVARVLKPGGHLLAMGGTRTFHRLACAIEDAGFEIRDTVAYLYGSGFPKSLSVNRNPMFCRCAAIGRSGAYKGREHSPDLITFSRLNVATAFPIRIIRAPRILRALNKATFHRTRHPLILADRTITDRTKAKVFHTRMVYHDVVNVGSLSRTDLAQPLSPHANSSSWRASR
jgi:DNA modification methylase